MAKRIYPESVKKWAIGAGVGGASIIFLIFAYLLSQGLIIVHDASGDMVCAGTLDDPCYAVINFTVRDVKDQNDDIFIYPVGNDPWGRNTPFNFSTELSSWKLQRSWGSGWRDYDLENGCTGTWCGAPKGGGKYSVVFREGRNYNIRIVGYKLDPSDLVEWSFNPSGQWLPVQGENFQIIEECKNVTKSRFVEEKKEIVRDCSGNASCFNPYYVTSQYWEDYVVEECEESGVKKGNKEVSYKQSDKSCWRVDEVLYCLLNNDGGAGLKKRGESYRNEIRSGESGDCFNITKNFEVIEDCGRSDFGEVKI